MTDLIGHPRPCRFSGGRAPVPGAVLESRKRCYVVMDARPTKSGEYPVRLTLGPISRETWARLILNGAEGWSFRWER